MECVFILSFILKKGITDSQFVKRAQVSPRCYLVFDLCPLFWIPVERLCVFYDLLIHSEFPYYWTTLCFYVASPINVVEILLVSPDTINNEY